jgi:hypothetical protein
MAETTLRESFNASDPNRLPSELQDLSMGELLTLLINALAATESALAPASNVITLAATPSALFDVNVTAGTVTGAKKILKGFTGSDGVITPVPATGEATWNGGTKVRLASADAATAVSVKYATAATSTPGYLRRKLAEVSVV